MKRWIWDKDRPLLINVASMILKLMVFIMLFYKFIANDIPIVAKSGGQWSFPVCQEYVFDMGISGYDPKMQQKSYDFGIYPIIKHSPSQTDLDNILANPGTESFILGSDKLGRDVLSGLIYGTSTAVKVSLVAVLLSLIIAIFIGVISGYYNKRPIRLNTLQLILGVVLLLLNTCYFISEIFSYDFNLILVLIPMVISFIIWYFINPMLSKMKIKKWNIAIHQVTDRIIEVREAIPIIFLILAAVALFRNNSIWNVALVIGLIGWGGLSRYIRAEVMKVREKAYVDAAIIQGQSTSRIIWRHVLPNALDPLLSIITFSFTAAVLFEATLSFLGIGMPPDQPTWGLLLAQARSGNAWWLAIFPGLCIFIAIASLNTVADYIQQRLDSRIRQ